MPAKTPNAPCVICNPENARPGEYCSFHQEELHRLDHQYEGLFRLERVSRGKDHETYNIILQGECDPCGRILVTETDPENLSLTVVIASDVEIDDPIPEYDAMGFRKTYGDHIRERIERQIVRSWYGNSRACIDVFRTRMEELQHWDVEAEESRTIPDIPIPDEHSVH